MLELYVQRGYSNDQESPKCVNKMKNKKNTTLSEQFQNM